MAELGVKRLTELIGRVDLLQEVEGTGTKQQKLSLKTILTPVVAANGSGLFYRERNNPDDPGILNLKLIDRFETAVQNVTGGSADFPVRNTDRSVGARLSGAIAALHGNKGMAANPVEVRLNGAAGQSFGAWNAGGLHMRLTGDANDYVGKGMAGGKLVIRPPQGVAYKSHKAVIMGNTCLYGATGGRLYGAGLAGERFAVRNSGAKAVIEGIGDNGCEYMTGGIVTILGETGINFGAGMTGGFCYVLDEFSSFESRVNDELIELLSLEGRTVLVEHLRGIVNRHFEETGSSRAEEILEGFDDHYLAIFKLVKPRTTDVSALLGRRGHSARETLETAQ